MCLLFVAICTRPSFPKRHGPHVETGASVPPPPSVPPPSWATIAKSSHVPRPMAQALVDVLRHRDYVQQRLASLEAIQRSLIESAHTQTNARPGEVFLQTLDSILHQLGELAVEVGEAKAKVMHVDNYIASLRVQNTYRPPPVAQAIPTCAQAAPSVAQAAPSVAQAVPSVAHAVPSVAQAFPSVAQAVPSVAQAIPSVAKAMPQVTPAIPSAAPLCSPIVTLPRPSKRPHEEQPSSSSGASGSSQQPKLRKVKYEVEACQDVGPVQA